MEKFINFMICALLAAFFVMAMAYIASEIMRLLGV